MVPYHFIDPLGEKNKANTKDTENKEDEKWIKYNKELKLKEKEHIGTQITEKQLRQNF